MNSKVLQATLVFGLLTTIHLTSQACTLPVEAVINNDDPTWLQVNQTLCFDGSDSRPVGWIKCWEWDFADGTPADGDEGRPPDCDDDGYEVEHSYSNVDTYHPELYVRDFYEHSHTNSFSLHVIDISLTADSTYVCGDLVPIHLSIDTPVFSDKARLLVSPIDIPDPWNPWAASIKIWANPDKTDLIIPHNGEYSREWFANYFATGKTWYVEGVSGPAYVWLTFEYIAIVYPEQFERIVGPSPWVDFIVCDCTLDKHHCRAEQTSPYPWQIIGARADIDTEYAKLCAEGRSATPALSVCAIDVWNHGFAQVGIGVYRPEGMLDTIPHIYSEAIIPFPGPYYLKLIWCSTSGTHTYTVEYDIPAKTWYFTAGDWTFDSYYAPGWPVDGKYGMVAKFFGEVMNKQDDMPGTPDDRCDYGSCGVKLKDGNWYMTNFDDSDISGDNEEYGIQRISETAFQIWDKHPN